MRDNFSERTKDILAKRVAWRCSFPGCGINTIGPNHQDSSGVTNLGEAAHINAASIGGPRYDEKMSPEERRCIDNGIWLCRNHAKIIDADYINYSAESIRQWKILAEQETYRSLKELSKDLTITPTTLVALGDKIIFEGIWKAVRKGSWVFAIHNFILGTEKNLIDFNDTQKQTKNRYIVVESQGDGRFINGSLDWELVDKNMEITVQVEDKALRTTPYHLSDISAKMEFENGDFKIVRGVDCAKQTIMLTLSTDFGDMWYSPDFGSFFSLYYWIFKDKGILLTRLIKLEITRLLSIPHKTSTDKKGNPLLDLMNDNTPPLDFINRVVDVKILSEDLKKGLVQVRLRLEWGDGKHWEDEISIYLKREEELKKTSGFYSELLATRRAMDS